MMPADVKKLIRLYVPQEAPAAGVQCDLSERQVHYLRNVMRCETGENFRVFDGTNGEWLARLEEINKKKAVISYVEKLREQYASPDLHVLASPVKKEAFDFMVEKSSELGVRLFQPVTCERTVIHRVNEERMQVMSVEAAEQCERLDLMHIASLQPLENLLSSWDLGRKLIFCLEREAAPPIVPRLSEEAMRMPLAVLVGPEGGFTPREVEMLRAYDFVEPVSLGPRILRAETALLSALACVQATVGDWQAKPA